ncbi:MAG: ComF family protein, partial [Planctomycetes bacterium]|nr:ComF family protein [Planctomycetota bacterium]
MWSQTKECCVGLFHRILPFYQAGGHLLWPGRCPICRESILPTDEGLCQSCWQDLSKAVSADYCRRCGRDVSPYGIVQGKCGHCQDIQLEYDSIIRVGCYESTLRSMILKLKFSEKTEWVAPLATMLRQAMSAVRLSDQIDMLTPVPLHWRRRIKRGFNQSYLLAKKLKLPRIPVSTDLVRVRHTKRQWDLNIAQRRRNVKGAFAVRKGHSFAGKTVALVDDITTSGATLTECAKTLKKAGARSVYAVVVATAYQDE